MIHVQDLTVRFQDRVLLNQLSFSVSSGESLSILGPSGSGKTTLLRALSGFLSCIDEGAIVVGHEQVQTPSLFIQAQHRKCVLLFQDLGLWPHMTVKKHLLWTQQIKKSSTQMDLEQMLLLMGLKHREHAFPKNLSAGEKQRLALGRALMTQPDSLFLDEAFSSLDLVQKINMVKWVKEMQSLFGFSLLHVTHDPLEALHLSSKIGLLENGALAFEGKAFETMHQALKFWQNPRGEVKY